MERFERRVILGYVGNLCKVMKSNVAVQNALGRWAIEIASDSILDLSEIIQFTNDDEETVELDVPRHNRKKSWSFSKLSFMHRTFLTKLGAIVFEEQKKFEKSRPGTLERNLRIFGTLMGLDQLDVEIFGLAVRYKKGDLSGEGTVEPLWDMLCKELKLETSLRANPRLFSIMLNADRTDVSRHLQHSASLITTGLFCIDSDGEIEIPERVLNALCNQIVNETELKHKLLGTPTAKNLSWKDFQHLGEDREHILKLLKGALEARVPGINILLYGPPGTGKTEFAKTISSEIGAPLYMIGETDVNGDEPDREDRVGELRIAQKLLSGGGRSALVLFDEAEDMFGGGFGSLLQSERGRRHKNGSKVFTNRCLENTPIPIIWTTNEIKDFDPALLRRMTFAVEFRVPPLLVRQRVLSQELRKQNLVLPMTQVEDLAKRYSGIVQAAVANLRWVSLP